MVHSWVDDDHRQSWRRLLSFLVRLSSWWIKTMQFVDWTHYLAYLAPIGDHKIHQFQKSSLPTKFNYPPNVPNQGISYFFLVQYHGILTVIPWSSCQAEIYLVDECTKQLENVRHILSNLNLQKLMDGPTTIYNDNTSCVNWSHNLTNCNLQNIQMRENAICENVKIKIVQVLHCDGKTNTSDIFTKEDKDREHLL